MFALRRIAVAAVVVASGLLSALGGTAVANGGSGSATACLATSKKVIGGRFLVNLTASNVDPSQKGFATCGYAGRVARRVIASELKTAKIVEGFSCTVNVLRSKPPKFAYHCVFQGADTATEVGVGFTVAYAKEAISR